VANEQILVVDDTPANLKLARVLLMTEGYSVLTAENAEQALEVLKTAKPRLILMDLQLPGIDGLELTRRIKTNPETGKIIIIALTSYAMKGDKEKAMAAGCDGYLSKPIDTLELPKTIARLLGRS
jgi:CheY-like chemotaxis protein